VNFITRPYSRRIPLQFHARCVVRKEVRANLHDPTPWNVFTAMNLNPPTPRCGLHRTLRVLSLLLLQHALAPHGTDASARSRLPVNSDGDSAADENSRPYLKVAGSLPLRFSPAPRPLPALVPRVTGLSPPIQPSATTPPEPAPGAASTVHETKIPSNDPPANSGEPTGSKPALSILPDNTRPSTRPEDFLPFFQFPGGGGTTIVGPVNVPQPPAPGQLPPSSATYQQR